MHLARLRRSRLAMLAVSAAAAVAFSTVTTIATDVATAPPAAAATAEGYKLRTASGGTTFAGKQAVRLANGQTFIGDCIDPGIAGPGNGGKPALVVDNLPRFGGNIEAAGRILNHPDYLPGKGAKAAAIRWAALNRLLDGKAGRDYNAAWSRPGGYAAQLAKIDPSIPAKVQALINLGREKLPINTWRYDSISVTQPPLDSKGKPVRQALAASGFSVVVGYVCPRECVSQGITSVQARNLTGKDTYRVRLVNAATRGVLYTSPTLRPGQSTAAFPRFPDATTVFPLVEKWTAKGWALVKQLPTFEVVCPVPPKVEVTTRTCCVDGTVVIVQVKNTTRRTAVYDLAIGARTFRGTLAPGKVVTQGPARITASTLVTGSTYVLGPNGPTGYEVTAASTVHPGTVKPVVKTTTAPA